MVRWQAGLGGILKTSWLENNSPEWTRAYFLSRISVVLTKPCRSCGQDLWWSYFFSSGQLHWESSIIQGLLFYLLWIMSELWVRCLHYIHCLSLQTSLTLFPRKSCPGHTAHKMLLCFTACFLAWGATHWIYKRKSICISAVHISHVSLSGHQFLFTLWGSIQTLKEYFRSHAS